MITYGCLRVYNADIEKLVAKYLEIEKVKTIKVYIEEVSDISKVYEYYGTERDIKEPKSKAANKQNTQ